MDRIDIKVDLGELFELLDKREETDSGKEFSPNYITSCRAVDGKRLNQLLIKLKGYVHETNY